MVNIFKSCCILLITFILGCRVEEIPNKAAIDKQKQEIATLSSLSYSDTDDLLIRNHEFVSGVLDGFWAPENHPKPWYMETQYSHVETLDELRGFKRIVILSDRIHPSKMNQLESRCFPIIEDPEVISVKSVDLGDFKPKYLIVPGGMAIELDTKSLGQRLQDNFDLHKSKGLTCPTVYMIKFTLNQNKIFVGNINILIGDPLFKK